MTLPMVAEVIMHLHDPLQMPTLVDTCMLLLRPTDCLRAM